MPHRHVLSLYLAPISSKAAHADTCKQSHSPSKAKAGSRAKSFVCMEERPEGYGLKKNDIFPVRSSRK